MEYQMRNWYHFVWLCGDHICRAARAQPGRLQLGQGRPSVEANGMGSCHCRDNRGVGQIYDNHFVEFTYADGMQAVQPMPPAAEHVVQRQPVHPRHQGRHGVWPATVRDGSEQEHVDLIDAIRNGEKQNDGWYGATSSFTAVLGRMATYSGQEVKWDEAVAKGPDEMPEQFAFDADPPVMPDKDGNYPMAVPGIYKPYTCSSHQPVHALASTPTLTILSLRGAPR